MNFLLLALLASAAGSSPGASSPEALRVSGVVTSSRDGSPVAHCSVTLTASREAGSGQAGPPPGERSVVRMGRPGGIGGAGMPNALFSAGGFGRDRRGAGEQMEQEMAVTDVHGHFSIAIPHDGAWVLSGVAHGYRGQLYEQHDQYTTALVLSAKTPEVRVDLVLKPAASVSGFVRDEAGEAVRSGQVILARREPTLAEGAPVRWQPAGFAQTDDRGHYELTGLADGDYHLAVSAQPWYASAFSGISGSAGAAQLDPSLDVVYPVTWFPGTAEEGSADTLALHAGEERQANFQLQAIPALHLTIPGTGDTGVDGGVAGSGERLGGGGQMPQLIRRSPGGLQNLTGYGQATSVGRDGSWNFGGLRPGTYDVRLPGGANGTGKMMEVMLSQGSSTTLNLDRAIESLRLQVQLDGAELSDLLAVNLTDVETGQVYSEFRGAGRTRVRRRGGGEQDDDENNARSLQVPPGDYFVSEGLSAGLSVSGLSIADQPTTGAKVERRILHMESGSPVLTLHVQRAQTEVKGIATEAGKPDAGAMVLLVPASYGSANSLAEIRREQTATDGSFAFPNVAPGPHLLLSLAHGWEVNWRDPATLAHYLAGATPLNVPPSGHVDQQITSVAP